MFSIFLVSSNSTGLGSSSLTETVLEATGQVLQMTHATSTGGLSSLGLGAPVEGTHTGSRVGALGAGLLLLVVGTVTATLAEGVGFSVTLTGRSSTFGLETNGRNDKVWKFTDSNGNVIKVGKN